jgi:prepilin-type N-terminal cleavage/methylation domain-containing protein
MKRTKTGRPNGRSAGFTMVELLMVVAIMAIAGAVAVPQVAAYLRTYAIRKSAEEIKAQIQSARTKAIMKNVNHGVVFLVLSNTTYQVVIEDDVTCIPQNPVRRTITDLLTNLAACADPSLPNPQLGPLGTLPDGVQFVQPTGANDSGLRFDRLGQWVDPGDDDGFAIGTGAPMMTNTAGTGSVVTVQEISTGLERSIQVSPGGRVMICIDEQCQYPQSG